MTVYRVSNYLDDCLYKLDVFFLVSDGVLRLADVPQSENLLLLDRLDRRAVLLASCDVSRGLLRYKYRSQEPLSPVKLLLQRPLALVPVKLLLRTDVMLLQMSCLDRCRVRTNVLLGQMSC